MDLGEIVRIVEAPAPVEQPVELPEPEREREEEEVPA